MEGSLIYFGRLYFPNKCKYYNTFNKKGLQLDSKSKKNTIVNSNCVRNFQKFRNSL